ncbi:3-beta hydroxysteroid dehydrogenase/isomerase family protein [Burkholderia thailandensis MSMB121]|uniref:NAD-dependent epimerase/dehydratase family protein n=1 Tax=Burkholderia humptydooensis TaxID=430531 RepID=UPI00032803A5|nr:NAD-dependent epimerase/dehydratase family protein [Burkholderia humptydooensis]AGK47575.1 3-beta hydroxysteroid dehydrogenase/isomerase family protein [Burkholderia thailandensis MSMB121]ATF36942.1 epimerase [Burkholderia thailandensis]KST74315.1 epimerase [Burkholderia humptydooensis]
MNWLITGGCGFIGTALIRRLLDEGGHAVRVLDNLSTGTRADLARVAAYEELVHYEVRSAPRGVELIVGDIVDAQLAVDVATGCDIIVHLAANTGVVPSLQNPRADLGANVIGTFNYLEAARRHGIRRFVFASSGASTGEVEPPIHEEIAPRPASPYGASKLAGEAYASAYKHAFGIDTVMLRFGNVYGPGSARKSSVIAKFIRAALVQMPLEIHGDGSQTRDFIYIDDLVDAVMLASIVPDIGGEVFQIASGAETTIDELAVRLARALERAGIRNLRVTRTDAYAQGVRRRFSDTTKARVLLGWRPKVTLEEGLQETVLYFLDNVRASP